MPNAKMLLTVALAFNNSFYGTEISIKMLDSKESVIKVTRVRRTQVVVNSSKQI